MQNNNNNELKYIQGANPEVYIDKTKETAQKAEYNRRCEDDVLDTEFVKFLKLVRPSSHCRIVIITDAHTAGDGTNARRYKMICDYGEATDCFIIDLGDMVNNVNFLSVGKPTEDRMPPMRQIERETENKKNLAKKMIVIVGGNHDDEWSKRMKDCCMSISKIIADNLGVQYVSDAFLMFLPVLTPGSQTIYQDVVVFGWHGNFKFSSKASHLDTTYQKCLNAIAEFGFQPDIIIEGHAHAGVSKVETISAPLKQKNGKRIGTRYKNCRVQSLPSSAQESSTYALRAGYMANKCNAFVFDISFDENAFNNKQTQDSTYKYNVEINPVPILQNSCDEYTTPALELKELFSDNTKKIEAQIRKEIEEKHLKISEITKSLEDFVEQEEMKKQIEKFNYNQDEQEMNNG